MAVLVQIRTFIMVSVLALTCGFAAHATVGQPGTLDPFWATGSPLGAGKVITPVGSGTDSAAAIALQSDGKVVLAGSCAGATNVDFCALRYKADGTLDTTFGAGGKVITPVTIRDDYATSVVVQPDGKVLLAGFCKYNASQYNFCALRYKADGTLDTSFGVGGVASTTIEGDDVARAMALQPDGKIVLAGSCSSGASFCALRYKADGTLDTTFGTAGTVVTTVYHSSASAAAIALQPDGGILLAGGCATPPNYNFCALRYDSFGVVDPSFDNSGLGGRIVVGIGKVYANAIALQSDGKVLLAGGCDTASGTSYDLCAVRFTRNGTLDTGFGAGGSVVTPVSVGNLDERANAIAVQPDGKVLLAGTCSAGLFFNFCVVRYHSDGVLDTSFGNGGKVLTAVGTQDSNVAAMVLQPDGKILLAGYCYGGTNADFCAVRYDGGPFGYQNCKLDIDGDGRVLATTDMLIGTRIALGMTGSAVINGISFPATATRNTWPLIRDYLVTQCGLSLAP